MITVVNLNPCLDWSWFTGSFTYGGMNRIKNTRKDAAGKGINVCIALKNLGLSPVCLGFNYRENGAAITDKLDESGIAYDFVTVEGAVRVNIKLYDESGTMTELNQPGAYVPPHAQEELIKKITAFCKPETESIKEISARNKPETKSINKTSTLNKPETDTLQAKQPNILVLSGSRPDGVPADFYSRLCAVWKGIVIVDTEGETLRLAIDNAPPFFIKPNLFELESTFGVKLPSRGDIAEFSRTLIKKGVKMVCVSLGAQGAMLITADETHYSPALPVSVKAVQGAGDAMVAGMVYKLVTTPANDYTKNGFALDLLRFSIAASAATITREGTLMCDRAGFDAIYSQYYLYNGP